MRVQLQKIIRDLWIYKFRTVLSVFAICVGLVIFGGVATARTILREAYEEAFRQSNPAQVSMQIAGLDSSLLRRINLIDGVAASDAHYIASDLRVEIAPDEWILLELHASDDYSTQTLHLIYPEPGIREYAPARNTLWLDRSILQRNNLSSGDTIRVQNANGDIYDLKISGFVNDVIAFPSNLSDRAVAYVSFATVQDMKMAIFTRPNQHAFNTLYLRFEIPTNNVIRMRALVKDVQDTVQFHGYPVISTVFLPDTAPLATQASVLDGLLILSTLLSFGVTGMLIGNFISAIVGRQVNEIGIMKSLGAVPRQIVVLFFVMVIIIGLIAFVLSLPLTGIMTEVLSTYLVNMIDIDAGQITIPPSIRLYQLLVAIILPLLSSVPPVFQGATITVRDALRSDATVTRSYIRWLTYLPQLLIPSIMLQMALRNILLKPGRFVLTTLALTLPGALFIASFGVEVALQNLDSTLADSLFSYDVEFTFDGSNPLPLIEKLAKKQPNVVYVEAWRQSSIHRVYSAPIGLLLPPPNPPSSSLNLSPTPSPSSTPNQPSSDRPPPNRPPPPNQQSSDRPPPNRPPPPNQPSSDRPPPNRPPPPNQSSSDRPPPPNQPSSDRPPPPNQSQSDRPPPPNQSSSDLSQSDQLPPSNRPSPPNLPPPNTGPSISGDILLRGIPIESQIIKFSQDQLLSGTWLQDSNDLLLTYEAYEAFSLHIDGSGLIIVGNAVSERELDIAGYTGQMLIEEGFIDIDTFERFVPLDSSSIRLAIVTASKSTADINQLLEDLRQTYNQEGVDVNSSASIVEFIERRSGRISIITQTLIALSILIGIVSVIGLISTISINIRERTKSIGILRSLGSDYRHLGLMVIIESLTIVFMSYILAFVLSFVVGSQISTTLGNQIYSLDATYEIEPFGAIAWFAIVVLIGIIAALGPALYAINLTISDTLRYEG
jgi:ABC-type antimicrobial peptide transport system permease subunit